MTGASVVPTHSTARLFVCICNRGDSVASYGSTETPSLPSILIILDFMQRFVSKTLSTVPKRFFSGRNRVSYPFLATSYNVKFTDADGKTKDFMQTLLESMKGAGVPLRSVCGGNCVCGQCVVKLPPALHDQTLQSTKEKGLLMRKGKTGPGYVDLSFSDVACISLVRPM